MFYGKMEKVISFLEGAQKYHGAFSHWYDSSGNTIQFSLRQNNILHFNTLNCNSLQYAVIQSNTLKCNAYKVRHIDKLKPPAKSFV